MESMAERKLWVELTVHDGEDQTISLQSTIHKQKGPGQWDTFEQAKLLLTGLGQMLGMGRRPENAEYPGQPGDRTTTTISADGVTVPIPAGGSRLMMGVGGEVQILDAGGAVLWESSQYATPTDILDQRMDAARALEAVGRLRDLVADREDREPMFSGEEILAIINGDAADHEPRSQEEVDRRGMYAPPYDTIGARHVFPSMANHSKCTKCGTARGDVYLINGGRICEG